MTKGPSILENLRIHDESTVRPALSVPFSMSQTLVLKKILGISIRKMPGNVHYIFLPLDIIQGVESNSKLGMKTSRHGFLSLAHVLKNA